MLKTIKKDISVLLVLVFLLLISAFPSYATEESEKTSVAVEIQIVDPANEATQTTEPSTEVELQLTPKAKYPVFSAVVTIGVSRDGNSTRCELLMSIYCPTMSKSVRFKNLVVENYPLIIGKNYYHSGSLYKTERYSMLTGVTLKIATLSIPTNVKNVIIRVGDMEIEWYNGQTWNWSWYDISLPVYVKIN